MIRSILILWLGLTVLTYGQSVTGVVYDDVNKNNIRDAGEKGIANVAVSNQVQVVLTNTEGHFELPSGQGFGYVMISLPNGYQSERKPWQLLKAQQQVNFPLTKVVVPAEFKFIHASDTHISEASVNRMDKLGAVVAAEKPDFVLITGDLVRDALRVPEEEATRYYELFVANVAKLKAPTWCVPGNHEIFGIERHLSLVSPTHPLYGKKMYRHYLGPNYYSFNYGGIHFVGLDDVDFEDTWYFGRVDSIQFNWLKADLAAVPPTTPVVTFKHIPMFSGGLSMTQFTDNGPGRTLERENGVLQFRHVVSNAMDLLTLITSHPYPLSLSGHYHARQVMGYESTGQNVRFEQTASIVGPAGEGVLVFPSGVTVYTVKNGAISEGRFIALDGK